MPHFRYHLATWRGEPYPPIAELPTVEAESALQAMEALKQQRLVGGPGQASAFLRVIVSTHEDGTVRQAIWHPVSLLPAKLDN